jgi:hypothetical protein
MFVPYISLVIFICLSSGYSVYCDVGLNAYTGTGALFPKAAAAPGNGIAPSPNIGYSGAPAACLNYLY